MKTRLNIIILHFCMLDLLFQLLFPSITFSQSEEEDGLANKRENWFYMQRSYPDTVIKSDGYKIASEQLQEMISEGVMDNTNNWENIGPKPGYISCGWGSDMSGRVSTIAVHPTNPNIIYIGAAGGGVWKTTNGGGKLGDDNN